jgi:hypothetical protein
MGKLDYWDRGNHGSRIPKIGFIKFLTIQLFETFHFHSKILIKMYYQKLPYALRSHLLLLGPAQPPKQLAPQPPLPFLLLPHPLPQLGNLHALPVNGPPGLLKLLLCLLKLAPPHFVLLVDAVRRDEGFGFVQEMGWVGAEPFRVEREFVQVLSAEQFVFGGWAGHVIYFL